MSSVGSDAFSAAFSTMQSSMPLGLPHGATTMAGLPIGVSTDDVDVVIATSASSNSASFLESWNDLLRPYHVTIVQFEDGAGGASGGGGGGRGGGDGAGKLRAPPGWDAEVFCRADVKRLLGTRAACISARDSSCRCFGWLVSSRRFVVTFAEDCAPLPPALFAAAAPAFPPEPSTVPPFSGHPQGHVSSHTRGMSHVSSSSTTHSSVPSSASAASLPPTIHPPPPAPSSSAPSALLDLLSPVPCHLRHLRRPATPFHFNPLYDPFEPGTDFVRGYPFSLREGVPTVLSHGLWLNQPDYDAPTLLVKPTERNLRLLPLVQTVPKGTLFPMSAFNLAFDRELIGAAMFFPPLQADHGQPMGFHDDMWAGWCTKVTADHLGLGVKSGMPYVWRAKPGNAFANLRKEYKGLFWQEEIVPFFQNLQLPAEATSADQCYLEIARQVKEQLGRSDASLNRLADAMVMWIEAWQALQTGASLSS